MALISCPECNKEVSDKAPVCPSCGFEVAKFIESQKKIEQIQIEAKKEAYLYVVKKKEEEKKRIRDKERAERIRRQEEINQKNDTYSLALDKFASESSIDVEEAKRLLLSIRGWKDSDTYYNQCEARIEELRAKEKKQHNLMKKKISISVIVLAVIALIIFGFSFILYKNDNSIKAVTEIISKGYYACLIEHDWKEATCESSKTCLRCGCIQGDALEHDLQMATCEIPESCLNCGYTQGEALGHKWKNATCESSKMCERCLETEGNPLGHTRTYGTCGRCGLFVDEFRR